MATPVRTADTREKIIKDGMMKHRQTGIGLQRWRQRYVVFKITNSGRLEFVVYKDRPAIPDNEVKHVAIEEYGGLETNLKLENEKYTFAIVTSHSTDCFSADSLQELTEWTNFIHEYLGKELVLSITIPPKQSNLKSGKAQLRIRNTGFTITTCDNPPRSQGTWQIIHIRKYGGSESFKFQTGSKCPSGECLYTIQTDDNQRVKSLFNDLSQHKPIFTDDRVGRRMTLERSFGSKTNSIQPHSSNRFSLQHNSSRNDPSGPHLYENRDAMAVNGIPAGSVVHTGRRHSAAGGGELSNPLTRTGVGSPTVSIEDLTNRPQYANVNQSSHHAGRSSPTKKLRHHVPVPVDYYNVTPPQVIQKKIHSNSTPSSSPENENYMREDFLPSTSTAISVDGDYSMVTPGRTSTIVGDQLLFQEDSPHHDCSGLLSNGQLVGDQYQNLHFLQGNAVSGSGLETSTMTSEPADPIETSSQTAVTAADIDWSPHNYTNVQLAVETVQRKKASVGRPMERKISEPSRRETPDVPNRQTDDSRGLAAPGLSLLRNSHSNFELNQKGSEPPQSLGSDKPSLPDYYNIFVPNLPANSPSPRHLPAASYNNTVSQYSRETHQEADSTDGASSDLGATSPIEDLRPKVNGSDRSSTKSKSLIKSGQDRQSKSPVVSNYDTLTPIPSTDGKVGEQHYDSLLPLQLSSKSSSSSPEPVTSPTDPFNQIGRYERKVKVTHHHHMYEYIDVELEHSGESTSSDGVFSPSNSMEHPLTWMSPTPGQTTSQLSRSQRHSNGQERLGSIKETNTQSRRKHLPLQATREESPKSDESTDTTEKRKPRAPRLSRVPLPRTDSSNDSPRVSNKPIPAPRSSIVEAQNKTATPTPSVPEQRYNPYRNSASSDESNSSFELVPNMSAVAPSDTIGSGFISPSYRSTHEDMSHDVRKISNINVELVEDHSSASSVKTVPPPLPPRKGDGKNDTVIHNAEEAASGSVNKTPPLPPRPQEGSFTVPLPQAHFEFEKKPTPPKPRMLYAPDQPLKKYVALTFGAEEDSSGYTEVDIDQPNHLKAAQSSDPLDERVSYSAVSFPMMDALRATKEQVDDQKRRFMNQNP